MRLSDNMYGVMLGAGLAGGALGGGLLANQAVSHSSAHYIAEAQADLHNMRRDYLALSRPNTCEAMVLKVALGQASLSVNAEALDSLCGDVAPHEATAKLASDQLAAIQDKKTDIADRKRVHRFAPVVQILGVLMGATLGTGVAVGIAEE